MDSQLPISAYHNYMVNGLLVAGFRIGTPGKGRFFFDAPVIESEDGQPRPIVSANLFDSQGKPLLSIDHSLVGENPGACNLKKTKAGFAVQTRDGALFLCLNTIAYRNTYCTRFSANLYDERGGLIASGTGKDFVIHGNISNLHVSP